MVGVVEATEYRLGMHPQRRRIVPRWHLHRHRQALAQALMRALTVEVPSVLLEDPLQMAIPKNDHVVQALAPDAAQEALGDRVHPRRPVGDAHLLDAARLRHPREGRPELAVVVPEKMPWMLAEGGRLVQLLRDPGVGRVALSWLRYGSLLK